MGHRWVEHVGELELELEAASEAALFSEAADAFRGLVGGIGLRGEPLRRDVALEPAEPACLLVDWLNELVFLAEVDAFVPLHAKVELGESGLRATLEGVRGRPRHLVKGATLHGLEFGREGEAWRARVVLDV